MRDQRDVERAGKQRDQAELAFGGAGAGGGEARIPDRAEEEAGGRNALEEVDRLEQHRQHDADRREDGDGRGAEQPPQHQLLDAVAGPRPRLHLAHAERAAGDRQQQREHAADQAEPILQLVRLDGDRDHVVLGVGGQRDALGCEQRLQFGEGLRQLGERLGVELAQAVGEPLDQAERKAVAGGGIARLVLDQRVDVAVDVDRRADRPDDDQRARRARRREGRPTSRDSAAANAP